MPDRSRTNYAPLPDSIQVEHWAGMPTDVAARDPYVERYWLPALGPTGLVILRRCALDAIEAPFHRYDVDAFAAECGIGRPALSRTLDRLVQFGLGEEIPSTVADTKPRGWWGIRATVPPVGAKHYRRLPDRLVAEIAAANAR